MGRPGWIILTGISLLAVNLLILVLWQSQGLEIARENAVLENIEAAFLFIGMVLFTICAWRVADKGLRCLFLSLSLFYLTFCQREVELAGFQESLPFLIVFESPWKYYWLGALWGAALLFFAFNGKATLRGFWHWVRSWQGLLIVIAGILYGLGDLFDKNIFDMTKLEKSFYEEILEVNATALMLLCAIKTYYWVARGYWAAWGKD